MHVPRQHQQNNEINDRLINQCIQKVQKVRCHEQEVCLLAELKMSQNECVLVLRCAFALVYKAQIRVVDLVVIVPEKQTCKDEYYHVDKEGLCPLVWPDA